MEDGRRSSFLIPRPSLLGLTDFALSFASVVNPISVLG
jgi:hypothetical protein